MVKPETAVYEAMISLYATEEDIIIIIIIIITTILSSLSPLMHLCRGVIFGAIH